MVDRFSNQHNSCPCGGNLINVPGIGPECDRGFKCTRPLPQITSDLDEVSSLRQKLADAEAEVTRLKGRSIGQDVKEWLASDGFKLFVELKHGPIGEILQMLQDGGITRGKAAEAIAELMVGRTPPLPDDRTSEFAEDELPGETVRKLKRMLEDLTPGGSEFHNDPDRCVRFVQDRLKTNTELIKKQREAENEALDWQDQWTGLLSDLDTILKVPANNPCSISAGVIDAAKARMSLLREMATTLAKFSYFFKEVHAIPAEHQSAQEDTGSSALVREVAHLVARYRQIELEDGNANPVKL